MRKSTKLLIIVLWLAMVPVASIAQIGGGSIVGFVLDQSKAAIPGVAVTATNLGTGIVSRTTTNQGGYYEFPLLPAGRYTVQSQRTGFAPVSSAPFALSTGTRPRIDLTLRVASSVSKVQVTAQAPIVDATKSDLGAVINVRKVSELPLSGRNWQTLVGLQAGAVASPSNSVGGRGGMQFNGSPGYGNQILLDGVDMSFGEISSAPTDQAGGAGTSLMGGVSLAAISEVTVNSNSFSAEYGDALGGVVNITTKSGTNQYHGEAFEFLRNSQLDANSFFSNKSGLAKVPLRWNQFGGSLGGPIKKDKLFFFLNYEGVREHTASLLSGLVATPTLLSELTPALAANASTLPSKFAPTSNPLLGFASINATTTDVENDSLAKIDYNFGKQHLAVRYSNNWSNYVTPHLDVDNPQLAPFHYNNLMVEHTYPLSATMLNEFRFGYARINLDRKSAAINVLPGFFAISSIGLGTSLQSEIHYFDHIYTIADNFTAIRGAHSLKTGFQIIDHDTSRFQDTGADYTYNTLPDLLNDNPASVLINFPAHKWLQTITYAFYGQDDWRLSRNLLVNIGLRWEHYTPLTGMFNVNSSNPFGSFIQQRGDPMFASHWGDFGPRLGMVWDPLGNEKLVVRAGGGLTYMPQQPILYYDFAALSPLLPSGAVLTPSDVPAGYSLAFPFPKQKFVSDAIANPNIITELGIITGRNIADYNSQDYRAGQWNLSLQTALTPSTALQISYVGNHAYFLWVPTFPNQFLPHGGTRPLPSYGNIEFTCSCASSSYDALQVSLNQHAYHGLVFDAYYTWGKTLSYGGVNDTFNVGSSSVQDVYNMKGSYGPVSGDIRNAFTLDHSYLLPTPSFAQGTSLGRGVLGGWSLDGIMNIRSGYPLNVLAGKDLVRNQRVAEDRPDIVPGVDPYVRNTNSLVWLNPAAFNALAPYNAQRYGNLAYNALFGPGGFTYDAAVHKSFNLKEKAQLTFRAEAFNVFNHVVFSNPNNSVASPLFGQITSGSGGRTLQLALKLSF